MSTLSVPMPKLMQTTRLIGRPWSSWGNFSHPGIYWRNNTEKRQLGEISPINVYKYLKEECKEEGARLFSVVSRGNGHKLKHESYLSTSGNTYCEGDQALEQVAQGGCGVSPPWRYSKTVRTWSSATSSRWPCLSRAGGTR